MDERPLAGHRPAGARARLVALQGTRLPDRRPAGARDLPAAARRRACASPTGAGAYYAEYTYAPERPDPQRLHPGARRASTTTPRSPRTRSAWSCSKPATPRRAPRCPTTTPAPGRCTTSSANRTSTTTNCSPNSSSTCANARAKGRRSPPPPPAARRPTAARRTTPATPATPGGGTAPAAGAARRAPAQRPADRGRSDLLHDRPALHRRLRHAAGGLAADTHAARRHARRRADLAVEDLDRHA